MPRNSDPGLVLIGGGRASARSVEDVSLKNSDRDRDLLKVHVQDPSRAHMAVTTGVEDVANNFVADEVEGALAELAGAGAAGRSNGLIEGGTFTSLGLVLTLDLTKVLLGGTLHDYTGDSVVLADNSTLYVYIDSGTQILTSAGAPPPLENESVLIAEVTTAGGLVTVFRDGRFFVTNLDRKPPLTLRMSGPSIDTTSEACFITLAAAFLYLELYAGTGTAPVETHRILVRGDMVLPATMILPVSGLILEGDGQGVFRTGGVVSPMFNLGGRTLVQFKNLTFVCDHANSVAIQDFTGAAPDDLLIENCRFTTGAATWTRCVYIQATSPQRTTVRDCFLQASIRGYQNRRPWEDRLQNLFVEGTGTVAGTIAIALGDPGTAVDPLGGRAVVLNCKMTQFERSLYLRGNHLSVQGCDAAESAVGVEFAVGGSENSVQDSRFVLSPTVGLVGALVLHSEVRISACLFDNPRSAYAAETPVGVWIGDGATAIGRVRIENCDVLGFYNSTGLTGTGVQIEPLCAGDIVVSGGAIERAWTGIWARADSPTGTNNTRGVSVKGVLIREVMSGLRLHGEDTRVSECRVELTDASASAPPGVIGIEVGVPGTTSSGSKTIVSDSTLSMERTWTVEAEVPTGVWVRAEKVRVTDSVIEGFYNDGTSPSGQGVRFDVGFGFHVTDTAIGKCHTGIEVRADVSDFEIQGCRIQDTTETSILVVKGSGFLISGCILASATLVANSPIVSIGAGSVKFRVENNRLDGLQTAGFGILIEGTDAPGLRTTSFLVAGNQIMQVLADAISLQGKVSTGEIRGNDIDGFLSSLPVSPLADGIGVLSNASGPVSNILFEENLITRCANGVIVQGSMAFSALNLVFRGNSISFCANAGAAADSLDGMGSLGIGVEFCDNLEITDNLIFDVGHTQDNAGVVSFPGASVGSVGIAIRNCAKAKARGNRVLDCVSQGGGRDSRGISLLHTSAGLAAAQTFVVGEHTLSENTTLWNPGLPGNGPGLVGIIVQCALGAGDDVTADYVLRGVSVTGNHVDRVLSAGIALRVGDRSLLRDLSVLGNICTACTTEGIYFNVGESVPGAGGSPGLTSVLVSGNQVRDCAGDGIGLSVENPGGSVSQIIFHGNSLQSPGGDGISISALDPTCDVFDISILDNQILEPSGRGVYITTNEAKTFKEFRVLRNLVRDATGRGIQFESKETTVTGVFVDDNTISSVDEGIKIKVYGAADNFDLTGVSISKNRVQTDASGIVLICNGSMAQVDIVGNQLENTGTDYLLDIQGSATDDVNGNKYHEEFKISGNTLVGGHGARFLSQNSTGTAGGTMGGCRVRNFSFDGNLVRESSTTGFNFTLYDALTGILATDPGARGIFVRDNNFMDCENSGLSLNLGRFATDGTIAEVQNVEVSGNTFDECNTTSGTEALVALSNCSLRNFSVRGNSFIDCNSGDDSEAHGVIHLYFGHGAAGNANGVDVSHNQIKSCGAVGILLEDNPVEASPSLSNLVVSYNQIDNQTNDAIRLDFTSFGSVKYVDVSHNQVHTISGTDSDAGIVLWGCSSGTTQNISVKNNVLASVDADVGVAVPAALYLEFPDAVSMLEVCGNRVTDSSTIGIEVRIQESDAVKVNENQLSSCTGVSLYIQSDSVSQGLEVCGNQVKAAGDNAISLKFLESSNNITVSQNTVESVVGDGISLDSDTAGVELNGVSIQSNNVSDATYGIRIEAAGAVNWDVSGNTLYDFSTMGIYSIFSENLHNSGFDRNHIRNADNIGIRVHHTDADDTTVRVVSISGNQLHEIGTNGILFEVDNGVASDLRISENTIRNFANTNPASTNCGIQASFGVEDGSVKRLEVSRNIIKVDTDAVPAGERSGIFLDAGGTDQELNRWDVSHNNIALDTSGASAARCLYALVGADLTCTQRNWVFIGNILKEGTLEFSGAAWLPSNSIALGNISDDAGDNWTSFTATWTASQVANNIDNG